MYLVAIRTAWSARRRVAEGRRLLRRASNRVGGDAGARAGGRRAAGPAGTTVEFRLLWAWAVAGRDGCGCGCRERLAQVSGYVMGWELRGILARLCESGGRRSRQLGRRRVCSREQDAAGFITSVQAPLPVAASR